MFFYNVCIWIWRTKFDCDVFLAFLVICSRSTVTQQLSLNYTLRFITYVRSKFWCTCNVIGYKCTKEEEDVGEEEGGGDGEGVYFIMLITRQNTRKAENIYNYDTKEVYWILLIGLIFLLHIKEFILSLFQHVHYASALGKINRFWNVSIKSIGFCLQTKYETYTCYIKTKQYFAIGRWLWLKYYNKT